MYVWLSLVIMCWAFALAQQEAKETATEIHGGLLFTNHPKAISYQQETKLHQLNPKTATDLTRKPTSPKVAVHLAGEGPDVMMTAEDIVSLLPADPKTAVDLIGTLTSPKVAVHLVADIRDQQPKTKTTLHPPLEIKRRDMNVMDLKTISYQQKTKIHHQQKTKLHHQQKIKTINQEIEKLYQEQKAKKQQKTKTIHHQQQEVSHHQQKAKSINQEEKISVTNSINTSAIDQQQKTNLEKIKIMNNHKKKEKIDHHQQKTRYTGAELYGEFVNIHDQQKTISHQQQKIKAKQNKKNGVCTRFSSVQLMWIGIILSVLHLW